MDKEYLRFYQEVGENYPEEEIVYNSLRGRLRKKFITKRIEDWKGAFLDIGCNTGYYLADYKGGLGVGVDISLHVLVKAKNKCANRLAYDNLILGDAEQLSFLKSATFDNILCSELLEHVYSPTSVIFHIARILKPDGKALITVPNYTRVRPEWISTGILGNFNIKGTRGDTYYHTAFKPEELASMLEAGGLTVVEKGTLEKEVRYATKIPVVLYYLMEFLTKTIVRNKKLEFWNTILLDRFSSLLYRIFRLLKLDSMLKRVIREGARTYVLAQK